MRPRGLVRRREVPLGKEPGVEREADQFPGSRYRAGRRPAGRAHSLDDFEDDIGICRGASQVGDLDPLAVMGRADQHPARLEAHRIAGAYGEARPQNRPARRGDDGPGWLGGYHFPGERLPACAQLGQDERVLQGAFGVVGGLRALEPVEAGCGGGGMVAAGLRQAAVGEIIC